MDKSTDLNAKEYVTLHSKLAKIKGPASQRVCVECDRLAHEWSHIHNTDPRELYNYEPRCRSCHARYDFTEDKKARLDAIRLANHSEETKAKIAVAVQNRHSPGGDLYQYQIVRLLKSLGIDTSNLDLSTSAGIEEARRLLA